MISQIIFSIHCCFRTSTSERSTRRNA